MTKITEDDPMFDIDLGYCESYHFDDNDAVPFTIELVTMLDLYIRKANNGRVSSINEISAYIEDVRIHCLSTACLDNDMLLRIIIQSSLLRLEDYTKAEIILNDFIPKIKQVAEKFNGLTQRVIYDLELNFKDVLKVISTDDAQYKCIVPIAESFIKTTSVV